MSRYNTFAIHRPLQKKLYLRISNELDHVQNYRQAVQDAVDIFTPYFTEVEVLFASEQSKIIEKLELIYPVVSLDKEIKTTYNLDISRVYDIKNHKYLKHYENPENSINIPFALQVILYDHDIVKGFQFNKIKKDLEYNGCTVHSFTFVQANEETEEVLDFRDFLIDKSIYHPLNTTAGLLVQKENSELVRISYLHKSVDFQGRTSIPLEFKGYIRSYINSFKATYGIQ